MRWIKVSDQLPEEGALVMVSSGRAWAIAMFKDGDFVFDSWSLLMPADEIIEWGRPNPSFLKS